MIDATVQSGRRGSRAARTLAVVLVLLVGVLAVRHSLGLALANRVPDLALRLDRENAIVRAQAAVTLVQKSPDMRSRAVARDMALGALRRDAGNVAALSALGLASDRPNEVASAFTLSERLSRRSLATQLWLIEDAVAKNDVARALRHYDTALRTSTAARGILFPVLISAITDDTLRAALVRTLAGRPFWGGLYLQQLAQSGTDRSRIATLFAALKRRGLATGAAADAALYDRLIEAQLFDDAWRLYDAAHPGTPRAALRNGRFAEQPATPTPFDWQLSDTSAVSARIELGTPGRGELVFSTAAEEGGEAARQMLALPPRRYRIQADARIEAADALPYMRIVCLPAGDELLRQPLVRQGTSSGSFLVPAGCRAQRLSLVIEPAAALGSVTGALSGVRLAPMD